MRRVLVALVFLFAFPGAASAQLPPILELSNTLLTSSGTYVVGQTLTLTAQVTPAAGGTVDFLDGATTVCDDVPLSGGTAECHVTPLTAGAHGYLAQYSGIVGVAGSQSPLMVTWIAQAPLTVTADPKTITYGQPLPAALTATVTGTAASLLTGAAACAITGTPTNAGTYDDAIICTAGTLDVANFLLTLAPGDLTIAKAPLTLTANPATMKAGEALTGLGGTLSGFVGGETLETSGVSGAAQCAGPSPLPTEPGVYPGAITCVAGSFSAVNYFVKDLVPGTLTVLASTVGGLPGTGGGDAGSGGGGGTTTNTTTNVTNVGIVGGSGGGTTAAPKATLSLLTKKLRRTRRAKLKLRSTGAITSLKLVLKRNGKSVGKGSLAALNGSGRVTIKASKKLKKGLYTLQATWAGAGKKRFNLRVR